MIKEGLFHPAWKRHRQFVHRISQETQSRWSYDRRNKRRIRSTGSHGKMIFARDRAKAIASRTTSLLINNRCFLSKDRGKGGKEIFRSWNRTKLHLIITASTPVIWRGVILVKISRLLALAPDTRADRSVPLARTIPPIDDVYVYEYPAWKRPKPMLVIANPSGVPQHRGKPRWRTIGSRHYSRWYIHIHTFSLSLFHAFFFSHVHP